VIYRPHPRIASSTTPEVIGAHNEVIEMLHAAISKDPAAGHRIELGGNILALFQHCDAMVTDVSSVGLDFLYLRNERPLFITDRRDNPTELAIDAPVSGAADVINSRTISMFGSVLRARLTHDVMQTKRQDLRRFYFGDLAPGESTQRFLAAIGDVVAQRDRLLAGLPHHQVHAAGAAAATGDLGAEEDESRLAADNALMAADDALAAAEDALAAAKEVVASAHDAVDDRSDHNDELSEVTMNDGVAMNAGTPMGLPTTGGMPIR
jgi:hypothetical protein